MTACCDLKHVHPMPQEAAQTTEAHQRACREHRRQLRVLRSQRQHQHAEVCLAVQCNNMRNARKYSYIAVHCSDIATVHLCAVQVSAVESLAARLEQEAAATQRALQEQDTALAACRVGDVDG